MDNLLGELDDQDDEELQDMNEMRAQNQIGANQQSILKDD